MRGTGPAALRYFLDTEYNGWGGALISLGLVPEDGGQELYIVLDWEGPLEPWVERHVVPYLDKVPDGFIAPRRTREDAARDLAQWLVREHETQVHVSYPESVELRVVADWPEDISQFCNLLTIGPGSMGTTGVPQTVAGRPSNRSSGKSTPCLPPRKSQS